MNDATQWIKFKEFVGSNSQAMSGFMFRGQSNPDWPLQTTYHRLGLRDVATYMENDIPKMAELVESWDGKKRDLQDQYENASFLALLQHNGFPTPLLDWTMSPYIAAYFAFRDCENHPDKSTVKIYSLCHHAWTRDYMQVTDYHDGKPFVSVIKPRAMDNKKYLIQQGIFTLTNVVDIAEHVIGNDKQDDKSSYLIAWEFPKTEHAAIMQDLHLMGITAMSLFPSLEGICQMGKEELARSADPLRTAQLPPLDAPPVPPVAPEALPPDPPGLAVLQGMPPKHGNG